MSRCCSGRMIRRRPPRDSGMRRHAAALLVGALVFAPIGTPGQSPPAAVEAPAFEAQLNRDERQIVQRALVWLGLYDGWIDGVFGARSRDAIAAWQARADRPATGSLTEDE